MFINNSFIKELFVFIYFFETLCTQVGLSEKQKQGLFVFNLVILLLTIKLKSATVSQFIRENLSNILSVFSNFFNFVSIMQYYIYIVFYCLFVFSCHVCARMLPMCAHIGREIRFFFLNSLKIRFYF